MESQKAPSLGFYVFYIAIAIQFTPLQAETLHYSPVNKMRASVMVNLANYVNYHEYEQNTQRLAFCFLEDAPYIYHNLLTASDTMYLRGKELNVFRISEQEELLTKNCQLLFVDQNNESGALFAMLEEVNVTMMTIGESNNFINKGGIVGLIETQSRIKVFINKKEYSRTAMRFSSLLLKHVKFH